MLTIKTNFKDALKYYKDDKCISGYASDLGIGACSKNIIIESVVTGSKMMFNLNKIDYDASHEDIYGWNFVSKNGIKLLIIND